MSTIVFVDTNTTSPTSLLRLPFAPDRTSASSPSSSRSSSSSIGTAGIVLISVGVGALVLSILVALGGMVMVRRRTRRRREELIRTERVCWRVEGDWRSISDLEIRRANTGRSLMRREDELEVVEGDGEGEKRLSTSLIHQPSTHQQQASPSPTDSTPLPPYFPSFPRSRPLQDIPSDAASFSTTQAHTPYTSLVQVPRTSSSRPATQFSAGDASSGYSVPFVLPPPPPVRAKSGRGRWE